MSRHLVSAVVGLSLIVSCTSPGKIGVETANALCPMGQEPVLESGGTMVWRKLTIGFCCKRCEPMFESLSDAEKVAALESVGVDSPR